MSQLEEDLAFVMGAVGLPTPIRELHPFWCCEHPKSHHRADKIVQGEKIAAHCNACPVELHRQEYDKGRGWAVDFAWPDHWLVVECEGGVFDGRAHGSVTGILRDIEKYNALTIAGWRVYRCTRREITSGQALTDIEHMLRVPARLIDLGLENG